MRAKGAKIVVTNEFKSSCMEARHEIIRKFLIKYLAKESLESGYLKGEFVKNTAQGFSSAIVEKLATTSMAL